MSKRFLGIISAAIVVSFIVTSSASATIAGSKHDFSGISKHSEQGNINEICASCHTPHSAKSTLVPLWWRALTSTRVYTLYQSETFKVDNQPLAPTIACLTCHDGTMSKAPANGCNTCHRGSNSDLSDDHPVSFVYDNTKYTGLKDPLTQVPVLGKSIKDGMLYANRVECTSCHDVHATKGDSKNSGQHLLLVNNQDKSKLCLTCHNK